MMTGRNILRYTIAGMLLLSLLYLLFRNFMLHSIIERIAGKLEKDFNLELVIGKSEFSGLVTVNMNDITILPERGDTLLRIDTLSATPSIGSLLFFTIRMKSLEMKSGYLHLVCQDSVCNYSALIRKESDTVSSEPVGRKYSTIFYRFFSKAFDFAPQNADLRNLELSFITDTFQTDVRIPMFSSSKEEMEGELEDLIQGKKWKMTGTFDQNSRKYNAQIYPLNGRSRIPLLKELFGLDAGFDTVHAALTGSSFSKSVFKLSGEVSASRLTMYQKRISDDTVSIDNIDFDYGITITDSSISLDSTSKLVLNHIKIHPYVKFSSGDGKTYEMSVFTDTTKATDFFRSLPAGVFNETRGIEADGDLIYSLKFMLNSVKPDSLQFNSLISGVKFRLRKSGKENLFKLRKEFIHTVYEYGRPFRSFPVGPSNPDFTPLDQVSQSLKNAILTSEDGSFFFHNGFNPDAFRKSIAENYRQGKFARGGSTISMQLVKNVFLSRHKTIARKAEEALIVWLIESNRLASKERIFEVYLNIIELGPGIYGVGEASRFYFSKKPGDLTLSESIFLASLLPRPKWFKYSFDVDGNLKPYLADYYRVVSNYLLRKELITQEEYDHIVPNVVLNGVARDFVVLSDSIPQETDEEN